MPSDQLCRSAWGRYMSAQREAPGRHVSRGHHPQMVPAVSDPCCRVIENRLLMGLYPRFHDFLVPQLTDVPGARVLDVASARQELWWGLM